MDAVAVDRRPDTHPEWPSLYDLGLEILYIAHQPSIQPRATYLYNATGAFSHSGFDVLPLTVVWLPDVFRFTLYWSLILYTPMFVFCGLYAFFNLSRTPPRRPNDVLFPLSSLSPHPASGAPLSHARERRARLILTSLVLLTFLAVGVAEAVIGATVMAFVLFGLFKAARFNMSTYVISSFVRMPCQNSPNP